MRELRPPPVQAQTLAHELLLSRVEACVWTTDKDLRVTSWAGFDLLGSDQGEDALFGSSVAELFAGTGRPDEYVAAHRQALLGRCASFTASCGGRELEAHVRPLNDGSGETRGCVGIALDVTEHGRAAEARSRDLAFRLAFANLAEETLGAELNGALYQRIIEAAVGVIANAQAGTIWLKGEDGLFRLTAAAGFDVSAFDDLAYPEEFMRMIAPDRTGLQADLARLAAIDPEHHAKLTATVPLASIRASLSLPVTVDGTTLAYLHVHNLETEEPFAEHESQMARIFANQLGALIQRANLERSLREGSKRLARLLEDYKELARFGAEIETIHDTDRLIELGMDRLLTTLRFDSALLAEVEGDQLRFVRLQGVVTGNMLHILDAPLPLGLGLNGHVALTGEAKFVRDYPRWTGGHKPFLPTGFESMLSLPIKHDGEVVKTIAFGTVGRTADIDENSMQIAKGFVARLENAFGRVRNLEEIASTREATFRALGMALEYRDLETRGHTDRVVALVERFAQALDLSDEEQHALVWGAYLHDLGKIAVPDTILLKPGRLTEDEFEQVRMHTIYGSEMTRDIPFLPPATRDVIRSHHERWEGGGYPDGLANIDIPFSARMFSLVDVYDALLSARPYKAAWSHERAVAELREQSGRQFDPELVPTFLEIVARGG